MNPVIHWSPTAQQHLDVEWKDSPRVSPQNFGRDGIWGAKEAGTHPKTVIICDTGAMTAVMHPMEETQVQ